jgi:hypothetical protein
VYPGSLLCEYAIAPGAARSTWPEVREYLFDQCRMLVR